MKKIGLMILLVSILLNCSFAGSNMDSILEMMQQEMDRSVSNFTDASNVKMYYLAYNVVEKSEYTASARVGGLQTPYRNTQRYLDVDVRVGSPELDNTHEIRGGSWQDNYTPRRAVQFPKETERDAIRATLWSETEFQYRKAQERYTKVITNRQVKVEEEDLSNDFSPRDPSEYLEETVYTEIDSLHWEGVIKRTADFISESPIVLGSTVQFRATDKTNLFIDSEGSRLSHTNHYITFSVRINGMADDGMSIRRSEMWHSSIVGEMPDEETILAGASRLVEELQALIDSPIVEPYIGPAILRNRASGVFFHEIFGHRIEASTQKSASSGKTFTKKVNEQILPDFITVIDDPTLERLDGNYLRGYYKYDDEGSLAQKVTVVDKGVLKNFLTSRSPIENFPVSNGHGRREFGNNVVSRQGNLIVKSDNTIEAEKLRDLLIEECKKQDEPYGLIFEDISGGFTSTGRRGPQAFKVLPLLVTRVYADGRPDETVRGVDIVGTPLTSFSKIVITGDDPGIFNGTCGAGSGMVPVSAVSPSILVSEIEVQKRSKGQEKPPILPPPGFAGDTQ